MLAALVKAVLDWLTGLVKSEIKQDVKASDVVTDKETTNNFRDAIRRKLRNNKGCVCVGKCECGKCGEDGAKCKR